MIQLITDSTCDLGAQRAEELKVQLLPLSVHFGPDAFLDGVELSPAQFYERLAQSAELPTTSQINPDRFAAEFQAHLDRGDEVVGIFLSSELSGTFQSACIARDMLEDGSRVHLVDSRTVTFPLGLLVEEAARLRESGISAAALADRITALTDRVRLLAVVDTLKYLKMGGRISAATAVVGGVLGITPLVGILDGKVESIGKTRGRKAALRWMREHLAEEPIDFAYGIAFGHSNCPEAMQESMEWFSDLRQAAPYVVTGSIGAVVGTHAGSGATGIAYIAK